MCKSCDLQDALRHAPFYLWDMDAFLREMEDIPLTAVAILDPDIEHYFFSKTPSVFELYLRQMRKTL